MYSIHDLSPNVSSVHPRILYTITWLLPGLPDLLHSTFTVSKQRVGSRDSAQSNSLIIGEEVHSLFADIKST